VRRDQLDSLDQLVTTVPLPTPVLPDLRDRLADPVFLDLPVQLEARTTPVPQDVLDLPVRPERLVPQALPVQQRTPVLRDNLVQLAQLAPLERLDLRVSPPTPERLDRRARQAQRVPQEAQQTPEHQDLRVLKELLVSPLTPVQQESPAPQALRRTLERRVPQDEPGLQGRLEQRARLVILELQ
jgi:hypothetical protein